MAGEDADEAGATAVAIVVVGAVVGEALLEGAGGDMTKVLLQDVGIPPVDAPELHRHHAVITVEDRAHAHPDTAPVPHLDEAIVPGLGPGPGRLPRDG